MVIPGEAILVISEGKFLVIPIPQRGRGIKQIFNFRNSEPRLWRGEESAH
jgi:hypothetical protein